MEVRITERRQASGNSTLYIEYYEKGFRRRENLHLTLYPEDGDSVTARMNRETRRRAEVMRSERILNPPSWLFTDKGDEDTGGTADSRAATMTWVRWAQECVERARQDGNVPRQVGYKQAVARHISTFLTLRRQPDLLLKDVRTAHISDLYRYMREEYVNKHIRKNGGHLAESSLVLFGLTVNAMLNRAVREQIIGINPAGGLDRRERFRVPDTHREYLTAEELRRFLSVETATEQESTVQKAFGFACMTGLRISDMRRLTWSDIKPMDSGQCVSIRQQKTGHWVTVPLNVLALSLLPPGTDQDDGMPIFRLVKNNNCLCTYVRRIKDKAGITGKDLTFHCSRHTAATLAMAANADLSTVREILGHRSAVSTQVYAKVSIESKMAVVNLTDGVFD